MSYLEFYKKCLKTGKIPGAGLCGCKEIDRRLLGGLFKMDGFKFGIGMYWGSGYDAETYMSVGCYEVWHNFTPLRQNIILLLSAYSGELDKPKKRKK